MPAWNILRLFIIIFPVDSRYSFIIDACDYVVERNIFGYSAWAKFHFSNRTVTCGYI